jgi:hypothetical protein
VVHIHGILEALLVWVAYIIMHLSEHLGKSTLFPVNVGIEYHILSESACQTRHIIKVVHTLRVRHLYSPVANNTTTTPTAIVPNSPTALLAAVLVPLP